MTQMPVPLFDLSKQHANLRPELMAAFTRVLDTNQFLFGPELEQFEANCAKYLNVKHAIGVSSGTDALLMALLALGIKPGDEVLCPTFTFFATASCIARIGAVPVFVDVSVDDFCIDLADAAKKVSKKTKAIIPVHLFGQTCDLNALMAFAKKHNLDVIEDVAQAFGAKDHDRMGGSVGAIGTFSFYPSKNLGGFGDSGLVVTQDDAIANTLRLLRCHGESKKYLHTLLGGNFRMDAIQAALINVKLPHCDTYLAQRRSHAQFYHENLKTIPAQQLILPQEFSNRFHTWNQYTIRVLNGKRDALKDFLNTNSIGSAIYYPLSLDKQPAFQHNSLGHNTIHVARSLEQECLSLPIYPELTSEKLAYVCKNIHAFFRS
jgi:dTDP-4-amino-4,6-dideoxygalactose transaminase